MLVTSGRKGGGREGKEERGQGEVGERQQKKLFIHFLIQLKLYGISRSQSALLDPLEITQR